ncbi:MAG: hypothetical protein P4L22_02615 [Candidatus Babeliales bacterium]|nr:hypothetical protein [Candidatus Babeliales bacterium]
MKFRLAKIYRYGLDGSKRNKEAACKPYEDAYRLKEFIEHNNMQESLEIIKEVEMELACIYYFNKNKIDEPKIMILFKNILNRKKLPETETEIQLLVMAQLKLGIIANNDSNSRRAYKLLKRALNTKNIEKMLPEIELIKLQSLLSVLCHKNNDYQNAKKFLKRIIANVETEENKKEIAQACFCLAILYYMGDKTTKALPNYKKAIHLLETLKIDQLNLQEKVYRFELLSNMCLMGGYGIEQDKKSGRGFLIYALKTLDIPEDTRVRFQAKIDSIDKTGIEQDKKSDRGFLIYSLRTLDIPEDTICALI